VGQLDAGEDPHLQDVLQRLDLRDLVDDELDVGEVDVIGDPQGTAPLHLGPPDQLGRDQLAVAEDGVSVKVDHEVSWNHKHY